MDTVKFSLKSSHACTFIGFSTSPPDSDCSGILNGFHVGFKLFLTTYMLARNKKKKHIEMYFSASQLQDKVLRRDLYEHVWNRQKGTECVYLHLCSVSKLPSSFSLFVEFQERIRLSKEILGEQNN